MVSRRRWQWASAVLLASALGALLWETRRSSNPEWPSQAVSHDDANAVADTPLAPTLTGPEERPSRESVADTRTEGNPPNPRAVSIVENNGRLSIRAVDETGAGVPDLGVEVRHGANLRQRRNARTDPAGWVHIPSADLVANESGEVRVSLDLAVGPERPFRPDRTVPMVGEHVFVVPPLAQVALQVHAADVRARANGKCGVVRRHPTHGFGSAIHRAHNRAVPSPGERAHFLVIADSGPLGAFVALPGEQFETWLEFDAPPTGETRSLDLHLEQAPIRFRGRATDGTGAALVDTPLTIQLNIAATGDEPPYWEDPAPPHRRKIDGVTTDDAGHFYFALGPDWLGFAPAVFVAAEGSTRISARVDLPPLEDGERSLGDLALTSAPIGGGSVVNTKGVGIEGASVLLASAEERWGVSDGVVLRARTGADGSFVIPGPVLRGRLLLDVRATGYRDTKIDVRLPLAWDYRIQLADTNRIAGQLAADPGVDLALLQIRVQPTHTTSSTGARLAKVSLHGGFVVENLDERVYAIEVVDRLGEVVAALADVEARGDGEWDPRLSPLHLGPNVGTFTLRATGPGGALLPGVSIAALPRGGKGEDAALHRKSYTSHEGAWQITTRAGSLDAALTAPGYRPEILRAVARDHTAELRPAPRLTMRIEDLDLPLPRGVRVELDLGFQFSWSTSQGHAIPTLGGVAMAPIPTRGSYHVFLRILDDLDPDGGGLATAASNGPFELDPDALPAELVLVPHAGFETALERARAR